MTDSNVVAMTDHANAVREAVKAVIASGVSQAEVARETSMTTSLLSQILNGTYKAPSEKHLHTLQQWLDMRKSRETDMPTAPSFVETTTSKQVFNTLRYAHISRGDGMTVVMGAPGVGKSEAVKEYAKRSPNCWIVVASPSISGLLGFFYELAMELGIENAPRRKDSLCHAIRRRLEGSGGLIIIDEADHLQLEVIEELRVLQQKIGIGLALVGNPTVYGKMVGNSRNIDLSRLESRVSKKLSILKVKKRDIDAIAAAWQLTSDTEMQLIHSIAGNKGQLRKLSHTLRLASMIAQGKNERLNLDHVRGAYAELRQDSMEG